MCLRFVFLLITRVAAWLRLSRCEETGKTAEILILRHQLAILQRRQPCRPNLNWADRALLAALPSVIPKAAPGAAARDHPGHDPALAPRHRPLPLGGRSMRGKTGRPATRRNIRALVRRLARENPEWGRRVGRGRRPGVGLPSRAVDQIDLPRQGLLRASRYERAR
jgi:putative transposase